MLFVFPLRGASWYPFAHFPAVLIVFFLIVPVISLYVLNSLYLLDTNPLYLLQVTFYIYYEFLLMNQKILSLNMVSFIHHFLYG